MQLEGSELPMTGRQWPRIGIDTRFAAPLLIYWRAGFHNSLTADLIVRNDGRPEFVTMPRAV